MQPTRFKEYFEDYFWVRFKGRPEWIPAVRELYPDGEVIVSVVGSDEPFGEDEFEWGPKIPSIEDIYKKGFI